MKNLLKIPKPIIFEALPKDISGIMAVQKATWLATYVNAEYDITVRDIKVINFVSAERHKRWEGTLQKKKIIKVWVAKNKANKVVGFCVARKAKLCNILGAIYVLPRYQGKGIGQKLAGVAFEWLGKKDIVVDVVKYNATAIVFYKKLGFKKIGATPKKDLYKLPSGKMLPEVRMVRKV